MPTQERQRSFFGTTTGVVTGVAGLVTAIVGLLTAGVQLGWWGSDDGGSAPTAPSTASTTVAVATANFTADPSRVTFELAGSKESMVTVRNLGSAPIAWKPPTVTGTGFSASDVSCGARLDAGRSCQVRVTFVPPRGGDYSGQLVLQPENGPAKEVQLVGKALL